MVRENMRRDELLALVILVEGTGKIQPDRCTVARETWLSLKRQGLVIEHWHPTLLTHGPRGFQKAEELSHYSVSATGRLVLTGLDVDAGLKAEALLATRGPFVGKRIVKPIPSGSEKVILKRRPVRGRT